MVVEGPRAGLLRPPAWFFLSVLSRGPVVGINHEVGIAIHSLSQRGVFAVARKTKLCEVAPT